MNQDNTNINNQEKKAKRFLKLPVEAGIILAILILLAAVGIIGHQRAKTVNKKATPIIAAYNDEILVPQSLKGLSLQLPEELIQYSKTDTQIEFYNHYVSIKNHYQREIYSSVAYSQFSNSPSSNDLIALNANLQNPKYKNYPKTIAPIKKFVSDRLSYDAKPVIANGKQFKNDNIRANAWIFDLSAASSKLKGNPIKGQVLYLVNGQDQYYFVLYSSARDWPVNQVEWDKVFASLKYS